MRVLIRSAIVAALALAVVAEPAARRAFTTRVDDEFTDTNGTAIGSHTPTPTSGGSSWVADDGSAEIQTNGLLVTSTNVVAPFRNTYALGDPATGYKNAVEVNLANFLGFCGLVILYNFSGGNATGYVFVYSGTDVSFQKWDGSGFARTVIDTDTETFVSTDTVRVEYDPTGDVFTVFKNGTSHDTFTDSTYTAAGFGGILGYTNAVQLDNYLSEDEAPAAAGSVPGIINNPIRGGFLRRSR